MLIALFLSQSFVSRLGLTTVTRRRIFESINKNKRRLVDVLGSELFWLCGNDDEGRPRNEGTECVVMRGRAW